MLIEFNDKSNNNIPQIELDIYLQTFRQKMQSSF